MFNCKSTIFFAALVGAFVVANCQTYSDQYDDVEAVVSTETVLADPVRRNQYYDCFLGTGPCVTPDAEFFKDIVREALVTKCEKCTEKQKVALKKFTEYYTEKEPEKFAALMAKATEAVKTH